MERKRTDSLDDHNINLIGAELELVATQGVRQTKRHRLHVLRGDALDEILDLRGSRVRR